MGGVKKRKADKRLARRVRAWEQHGETPMANPGKANGQHRMHKPGSRNK
jgi:hypothetical protein